MNALEIKDLTKHYPDFTLDRVSLTLPSGCIMGLVGENGAGKSTTIRLILGMLRRDGGSIRVLGREDGKLDMEDIGVVLDEVGLPSFMNPVQIGKLMAGCYRQWDQAVYDGLVENMKLPRQKPFKDFSKGMKMKMGLAVAMSHHAKLLLLDEHTAALDPATAEKVLALTKQIVAENGITCLMITHNLASSLALGNRTIMMAGGHIKLDLKGADREGLTADDLLRLFRSQGLDNDRILFSE